MVEIRLKAHKVRHPETKHQLQVPCTADRFFLQILIITYVHTNFQEKNK